MPMVKSKGCFKVMLGLKKLVVPVRGDGKGDNVLRHAAMLAHRFDAHVDVTHVRARAEDMIPYGVALSPAMKQQILELEAE